MVLRIMYTKFWKKNNFKITLLWTLRIINNKNYKKEYKN